MQFIIKPRSENGNYCLTVFNCGHRVGIHNSTNRNYIKRVIRKYSAWVTHSSAACFGKPVNVIWA